MFANSLGRPNNSIQPSNQIGNANSVDDSTNDINLDTIGNNPTDSVSCIQWIPNPGMKIFAASTWDGKIHLYETVVSGYQRYLTQKGVFNNNNDPILSVSWKKDCSMIFAGCGDGSIKAFDINTSNSMLVGKHDTAVCSVQWIEQMNILMTMSFNNQIKFWQLGNSSAPAMTLTNDNRIFVCDFNYPLCFLGLSNEQLNIFDITLIQQFQNGKIPNNFATPLNTQTNCLSLFPKNDGFGIGSIDGRANLSIFSKDSNNYNSISPYRTTSKMTFKCHKIEEQGGVNILLPVHSIGFHPNSKSFVFTAGGDGTITYWDYEAKNKIKSFSFKNNPVTKAKISDDGQYMAYALGYDWSKGIWGLDPNIKPKIVVHQIAENEIKFNSNSASNPAGFRGF